MEIKLTSEMFEQGTISNLIGGSLSQAKSDTDNFIRSKELIPILSERKITLSGNPSGIDVRIIEFDKDQKMIAINVWHSFGWGWDLNFDTAYIAFVMAIPGGQSITRPFMVDTLSRIPYHDDWISIGVDQYRGACSTWTTKSYTDWGIKVGDVVTFQVRIKSTSGKKLRARIEWFNSNDDRISTFPDGVQVIENGEGASTITQTVPSGYSQMGLWIDANLTVATHTATTQELVKADIFVIGSSIPSNLDRGGVLSMSNYPDLPIITDESGFEYAEGLNLFINTGEYTESSPYTVTSNKTDNFINWFNKRIYTVSPCKAGQKITLQAKSNLPWSANHQGAVGTAGFWLYWGSKQNAIDGQYVKAQFIPGDGTTNFVKTITVPEVSDITEIYCCFRFNTYSDGTTDVTGKFWDLMLEFGDKKHNYRPNPADLVGGGVPMAIVARGLPLTVRNSIDEAIQNSAAQLEQRLSTAITQTGESIENKVAQQYYAKGDTDRLIAEASTILEQRYNSFEMSFNSFKQVVDNNQNLTNAEFATITKFIRFIDGNIFLGEEGNNQMLKIAKDRISFLQGNQEVAYISDSTLYIYDGVFLNSLRIGDFAFVPRANGSMDLKKVR